MNSDIHDFQATKMSYVNLISDKLLECDDLETIKYGLCLIKDINFCVEQSELQLHINNRFPTLLYYLDVHVELHFDIETTRINHSDNEGALSVSNREINITCICRKCQCEYRADLTSNDSNQLCDNCMFHEK